MRIAVYCSARPNIPEQYHEDARQFGRWIGENGHTLVYGGLTPSMMGDVSDAAAEAGAQVIGIVPQSRLAKQNPSNTVNIHIETLHERKQLMEENADVFVALEGGIGTLDELFSAIASATFFGEQREVHLLNRGGIYEPLHQLLTSMEAVGLVNANNLSLFHFHPDLDSLTAALSTTNN